MSAITRTIPIMKISAKKRIVFAVVYAPEEGDAHDHFMTAETIENMAHRWLIESRMQDEQHDFVLGSGHPVESFIVREGDKDFVKEDGTAMVGAWVLGTKITDNEVWKKINRGEINAFSIAGVAEYGKEKEVDSPWYDDEGNRVDPYEE